MPAPLQTPAEDERSQETGIFDLIRPCDVRGVLHSHSRYTDGAHGLPEIVSTARTIGLEYVGISDHHRSEHHQEGLDRGAAERQRREIDALRRDHPGFEILQGVEVEADRDGNLPEGEELALFDYLIVSFEEGAVPGQDLTGRMLRAMADPRTAILSKPIGDYMLRRGPVPLELERVLARAAEAVVAVEIDANPHSLELDWESCRRAQELGVMLVINPNAHRAARLVDFRHGVDLARSAGICCRSILNTRSAREVLTMLRRR